MAATRISPNVDNYYSGKGIMKFKADGDSLYRDLGDCPSFEITPNVTRLDHFSSRAGIRTKDLSLISQRQMTLRVVMDEVTADNLAMALMGIVTDEVTANITATLSSSTAVTAITPTTGLLVGKSYAVASTGVPAGTSMTYDGGGAGTLSAAATVSGSAHAAVLTRPPEVNLGVQPEVKGALRFVGTNAAGAAIQVDLPAVTFAGGAAINFIQEQFGNVEVTGEVTTDVMGSFGTMLVGIDAEMAV